MQFTIFFLCFLITINFSSLSCSTFELSKADGLQILKPVLPKKPLADIDLTTIKHITPKGRARDVTLADENFNTLSIADDLLAHGKYFQPES